MDNIELGWRGDWRQLSYQWVVYAMRKENVIVQDADRRNIGDSETEHRGLEYSLRWQISDTWDLRGDGTWARHRYRNNVRLSGLQAGAAIDGKNDILDILPTELHQRTPLYIGSREDVETAREILAGKLAGVA